MVIRGEIGHERFRLGTNVRRSNVRDDVMRIAVQSNQLAAHDGALDLGRRLVEIQAATNCTSIHEVDAGLRAMKRLRVGLLCPRAKRCADERDGDERK